jgi:hypothetical protein
MWDIPFVSPRLLVYLIAAVFCHAACIPNPRPPHRYVVAGQSNAEGQSTQVTSDSSFYGRSYGHDHVWRPIADPTIHYPGSIKNSPWSEMAIDLGGSVRLVASARGNTCLVYPHPTSGEAPAWRPLDGWAYADMLTSVQDAQLGPPDAVLWHQGECDAQASHNNPTISAQQAYDDYKAGLEELADWVWADLGAPLVVAPISLVWCRSDNPTCDPALFRNSPQKRIPIHDATVGAAASHPHIILGPSSDDLLHEPDDGHIHDVVELGRRWAAVLRAEGL